MIFFPIGESTSASMCFERTVADGSVSFDSAFGGRKPLHRQWLLTTSVASWEEGRRKNLENQKCRSNSRPRVLHAVKEWLPGTENWCFGIVSKVPGDEVHVVSRKFLPNSPWRQDFHFHQWPLIPLENRVRSPRLALWNRFAKLTYRWQTLAMAESLRGRVDLLHAHFSHVGWDYLPLAKRLGVPLVVSFYGYDYDKIPNDDPKWVRRYQDLFRAAAAIFCEGGHGVSLLRAKGCDSSKLHVARLGVDVEGIRFLGERPTGRPLRLLQLARLTEKKGHADAIRAIAMASKEIDLEFTIVGGDADVRAADLAGLCSDLGVSDRVRFETGVDFRRLHEYLAGFDLFLHPSRMARDGDCEGGAPVVLLDAQAVGLPVVSTRHCDIPDEVVDGVTGYLSAEGDVASLARSIVGFARLDEAVKREVRLAGRRHVEKDFDSTKNGMAIGEIYQRLVYG